MVGDRGGGRGKEERHYKHPWYRLVQNEVGERERFGATMDKYVQ